MNVIIQPSTARGHITAPPSKSMAHRALICGALSAGSTVENVAYSEDIRATLRCLAALGAHIEENGDSVRVGGLNPATIPSSALLDCGESGSTLRFMIPLCLLSGTSVTLTGSERLMQRPLGVYADLCAAAGLHFEQQGNTLTVCGPLKGGRFAVPGDVSSQFISGLLFALPLAEQDSVIHITGKAESLSYIDLTLKKLTDFGIRLFRMGDAILIPARQTYLPRTDAVEGDWSNAAFLDVFNLFGGDVTVEGLDAYSPQGDRVYRELFVRLATNDPAPIDLADCPDLAPVLFAVAAAAKGGVFENTARLKIKESDRAAAMQAELAKCGIPVTVEDNRVIVHDAPLHAPDSIIDGHNDHRIVMAMSALCSIVGGEIAGAEAVAKSYPTFFDDIARLGIQVNKQ